MLISHYKHFIKINGPGQPITNLLNANAYGYLGRYNELIWHPEEKEKGEVEIYVTDPVAIPNLTGWIRGMMELLPEELRVRFGRGETGADIDINILENEIDELDNEPTYKYHPRVWRDAIPKLLPWLWDLDPTTLANEGEEWDWERLVRRLAREELFRSPYRLEGLPAGLMNRRRIWRLCQDWAGAEGDGR